jgi:hypothetical protein
MAGFFRDHMMELIPGDPEALRWFKSRTNDRALRDSLFLYKHHATGKFMLGRWITQRGVFSPLLDLGTDLFAGFSDQVRDDYLKLLHPETKLTVAQALQQAKSNQEAQVEKDSKGSIERRNRLLRDECHVKAVPDTGVVFLPTNVLQG